MKNLAVPVFYFHEALDAGFLHGLFAGDLAYAATVFEEVANALPQHWAEMENAYKEDNVPGLKAAVHKCKTLFAYVGLSNMEKQLQQMETACGSVQSTQILAPAFEQLRQQRQATETILNEETKRMRAFYEN